ncbi:MAG: hypothetical protein V2I27_06855 [Erythrobacter sp.]|jgi:hypothetical protein|nr:hypothetical protein [Erythrobacter sp.]
MIARPILLAAAFAFNLWSAGAAAQETTDSQAAGFDETRIIDQLDDSTLRAVLTQLSATATPLDEESTILRIAFPNGLVGISRRIACTAQDACKGLMLTAYIPVPEGMPEARSQEVRQQFGLESLVASVVVNQLGEHVVKTYVILDGGITSANLAIWIGLFSESARAYQEALYAGAP